MRHIHHFIAILGIVGLAAELEAAPVTVRVLDAKQYHLGTAGLPEWRHFANSTPHGRQLDVKFNAVANATEQSLFIRQKDVKQSWEVRLNGRKLGALELIESHLVTGLAVPAGTLRDGENVLSILPPKATDDILVGEFKLESLPLKEALSQTTLNVTVVSDDGRAVPCRITIADERGALAPVFVATNQMVAVRTGVVYTGDGKAQLGLRPGNYFITAGRGFEYSVAAETVSLAPGQINSLPLHIRREVPTAGYVACDSHIHTVTYSGHGDAKIDESMLTIAGEGIEVAIATDHNHHTDYTEAALRMKVNEHFTAAIGNEVTTKMGHFNAFPVKPGSTLPNQNLTDWPELMRNIRATTGAQVVQLNHPRNVHSSFQPFNAANYNQATGENLRGPEFGFDAVEVVTSAALQSDPMLLFRDWFGLLNYGYRITGVGSSDTHNVSRYILGQGRSYVVANDANPARIDMQEIVRSYRAGKVLISMGLLATLTVDGKYNVGDLATGLGARIHVKAGVLGPTWVTADNLKLFANGIEVQDLPIPATSSVTKYGVDWHFARPVHDMYLVVVATGPGVTAPYWEIPRPYQPTTNVFNPRIIGATNPIWLDGDGDGKFTAPRQYAQQLVKQHGMEPTKLLPALSQYDQAIATQVAALCHVAGKDIRSDEFARHLKTAVEPVQKGFAAYAETLEKP
ncbi:MAG: CehA/McbA family metallohydrolase [Verrucomicrobiota bacterium]